MPSPFRIEQYPKSVRDALTLAMEGIGTDGAHHKQWYLDQIVRALTNEMYESCVHDYCNQQGGPYGWDEGIAP